MNLKIKEGFRGQRMAMYPQHLVGEALASPLTQGLVVQSMGYFPNAAYHYEASCRGSRHYMLVYCSKGRGFFTIDGERHEVHPQQFFIIPPDVAYEMGAHESCPWSIYWIHMLGDKAKSIYQSTQVINTIPSDESARFADRLMLFDQMLNVMERDFTMANVSYVNLCLYQLIATFLYVDSFRAAKRPVADGQESVFISRALDYMNENVYSRLTITDMARALGYSDSYFYRLFFRHVHQAPMSYFMGLKLERACDLLSTTSMQVCHIALQLGFDDSFYFSRFFKKQKGMSPRQYRESSAHLSQNPTKLCV